MLVFEGGGVRDEVGRREERGRTRREKLPFWNNSV